MAEPVPGDLLPAELSALLEERFTIDDLSVLMEAMEAWEAKGNYGNLLSSVMGAMLVRGDDEEAESARAFREREAKQRVEAEEASRLRKERSILIRAKLVMMMDRLRAETLIDDAPAG